MDYYLYVFYHTFATLSPKQSEAVLRDMLLADLNDSIPEKFRCGRQLRPLFSLLVRLYFLTYHSRIPPIEIYRLIVNLEEDIRRRFIRRLTLT